MGKIREIIDKSSPLRESLDIVHGSMDTTDLGPVQIILQIETPVLSQLL